MLPAAKNERLIPYGIPYIRAGNSPMDLGSEMISVFGRRTLERAAY
jgi:hypothetical protein